MTDDNDGDRGFLTDEFIDSHNARVAAFRALHLPRIQALTEDECLRIYERWTQPGTMIAANEIALEFRKELGMTWSDDEAVAIGLMLMPAVLGKLDRYDPDFRPEPRTTIPGGPRR